eukprot:3011128-Rhodomonas_salina.1
MHAIQLPQGKGPSSRNRALSNLTPAGIKSNEKKHETNRFPRAMAHACSQPDTLANPKTNTLLAAKAKQNSTYHRNVPDLLERSLRPDMAGAWKAEAAATRAKRAATRRTAMTEECDVNAS